MGMTEAPGVAMERRARGCDTEFWPRVNDSSSWNTEHRACYVQQAAESRSPPARRATQLRLTGGEGAPPPDTEHRARYRPPPPAPRTPRVPRPQSALRAFGWPREGHSEDVERRPAGTRLRASSGGRSFGSTSTLPRIRERSLPRRGKVMRTSKSSESSRKQSLVQLNSPRRRPILPTIEQRPAFRMTVHQEELNPRIRWTSRRSHSPAFIVLHRSI